MADVANLGVEDDGDVGRDGGDGALQGDDPRRAPLQIEAQIGLVGAHQVGRGVDDAPVEGQDRLVPLEGFHRHPVGLRVEAEAQPGVVGLLGRRQFIQVAHRINSQNRQR